MISELTAVGASDSRKFGHLAEDLVRVINAGIEVIPTAILPPSLFETWQTRGQIPAECMEYLLTWAAAAVDGINQPLIIRTSVQNKYHGLEDKVRAGKSFADLKSAIERVYRSWGSSHARASRVIRCISDPSSVVRLKYLGL